MNANAMLRFPLLLASLFLTIPAFAQSIADYKNSLRVGVNLTTLDAPDGRDLHYVGRYARHFGQDRFVLALEGGYLYSESGNQLFNGVDPGPNQRHRLTADLTGFVDVIRSPYHALRLGVGASAWYRREDLYWGAAATPAAGGIASVSIDRRQRSGVNTGTHAAVEYEWLFTPRNGLDARFRLTNIREAGVSSTIGVGLSHRF